MPGEGGAVSSAEKTKQGFSNLQATGHSLGVAHFFTNSDGTVSKFFNLKHIAAALKRDENQRNRTNGRSRVKSIPPAESMTHEQPSQAL